MQVKTPNDIGALIRDQRTQRGWSQEELARRVGVGRIWIVQLEKGKPTAQMGLALRTLKELGVFLDASTPESAASRRKQDAVVDLDRIIRDARSVRK